MQYPKKYNDKKVCFIFCTNNEQFAQECMLYLSLLQVPEGYEVEVLAIEEASSIAAGYNEGMQASDAKYKVYIHQDTFITEPLFIKKLVDIFKQDEQIGIVGMIGAEQLSKDGVMWHERRCGDFYRLEEMMKGGLKNVEQLQEGIREVEVVDGLLIATQYDIPWREDIFKGWDFYDVSQCLEFRRAGYRIVVPAQNPSWTIHACGIPSYWNYEENRQLALREYPEIREGKTQLKIFFLHSKSITLWGIYYSLISLGHRVVIPEWKVDLTQYVDEDRAMVEKALEKEYYDLVMTSDFCLSVAKACENRQVKYCSWVFDSPHLSLYTDYAKGSYQCISVFDRRQYERMKDFGLNNLYYIPLGADVRSFGAAIITESDKEKYAADVAFVGRLYDKRGYEELFDEQSSYLKEEFDQIVENYGCKWGGSHTVFDRMSEELVQHIIGQEAPGTWNQFQIEKRFYCESIRLAGRCNELERIAILNKLAERFRVTLYSNKTPKKMLQGVIMKPWVEYGGEMPKVFHISKINLNITSRSIESGIPQRVWDIMAVGGFCLTNYQEELDEYFVEGVDLEIYRDLDELMEKTAYYLEHEDKRIRIAVNGYKKVRELHTYDHRLKEMLNLLQRSDR